MEIYNYLPSKPLRSLFPKKVITEETVINSVKGSLYPEEMHFINNSSNKRKNEFTAGRICARVALKEFGYTYFPLLIDENRAPRWPNDISGTIAHSNEYCGVAVAKKKDFPSLGFDIEMFGRLKRHLWTQILTYREQFWIRSLPNDKQDDSATLIYSAKECFYKYQYQITERWVGFEDVEIEVNFGGSEFIINLQKDIPSLGKIKTTILGHFLYHENHVFTVIF